MTRYTVVWDPEVESAFIDNWVEGDSERRALLSEIANWVDANLAVDAHDKGRPDEDLARILVVSLNRATVRASVAFNAFENERLVRVIRLVIRGR